MRAEAEAHGQVRVLIIDDSPDDRATYRRLLVRNSGFRFDIHEAETGTEGLERARSVAPDCVLLDYRLPDIDGLMLVSRIVSECGPLPMVFLTGASDEELAARALSAGAQDYLSKDRVDADSLVRAVRYAIERNRASARITALNQELREELSRRLEELRAAHADAMRNERLAALGTLAAGVAHDLNNPLMGVITHIQYSLRRVVAEDSSTREALEKALKYSKRCADIVKDLLAYSRSSVRQPSAESDLHGNFYRALDEALADTRAAREAAAVRLILELEPGLPEVRVDASGMRQVFVNLLANAYYALQSRDERSVRIGARRNEADVFVTVADTGAGMEEEARLRAFEPFFTTKTKSGTGLGLALCKRIVESVGGEISVQSVIGAGTTFTLRLPIARQAQSLEAKLSHSAEAQQDRDSGFD